MGVQKNFTTTLREQAEGLSKTKPKEIRKREEMSNQQRIWKTANGHKMDVADIAVEITRAGKKGIISERNEVEK